METVPIEQAVEQTNATKAFTNGYLGVEHRAAGGHGLRHYSQGLTEKLCKEVPVRKQKITIVFYRK